MSRNHSKDLIGGTTVSATCIAANCANIKIFATGGIGGVHRDFNQTMDVSADLLELSRIPIAVVSSGLCLIIRTKYPTFGTYLVFDQDRLFKFFPDLALID